MKRQVAICAAGLVIASAVLAAVLVLSAPACDGPGPDTSPGPVGSTTSQGDPVTSAGPAASLDNPSGEGLFKRLAAQVHPMAVFAPTVLPEGAAPADRWLPVLEAIDPPLWDRSAESNPYVVGSGADSEIKVVYNVGNGWLVVIQNFHGDLGDVPGIPIGEIEGSPAALFEVNGGELVQWSRDGRWYGVFARGVGRDVLLATALGMRVV